MSLQSSMMPEETQRPRKHAKPWEVWYRGADASLCEALRVWVRFGRYKDEATAQGVLRQKRTDKWFAYGVRKGVDR